MLGRSSMRSAEKSIPPGALISFLQKGLQYVGVEESLHEASKQKPDTDFSLLSPHAMQALSRQHPPIQINIPPSTAAAALKARLQTTKASIPPGAQPAYAETPPQQVVASQQVAEAVLVSVPDTPADNSSSFTSSSTVPLHLQGGSLAHLEEAVARLESQKLNGGAQKQNGSLPSVDEQDEKTRVPPSEILELKQHSSEVFMCAWNPKYTDLIATGSGDASARIWQMLGPTAKDGCGESRLLPHGTDPNDVKNKDVTTLEWSPDGMLLATGSYDGIARVWNRAGVLVHTLRGHHGPIFSLKWNKRGNFLLSGSYDKTTIVWDVSGATGFVEQQFNIHFAPALDVDWKDDTTFASCSTDKTVNICRVGVASPLKTYMGHTDEVNAVKWDPSGTLLASCSDDCTAKVWDVESGRDDPLHDFKSHQQEIYTVKW